jgi:hypothetical protein
MVSFSQVVAVVFGINVSSAVLTTTFAQAPAQPNAEAAAVNGTVQTPPSPTATVGECWSSWQAGQTLPGGHKIVEGVNQGSDGGTLFLASGEAQVRPEQGSRSWVAGRSAAFLQAELAARKHLADYIGTDIRSSRSASLFKAGGDAPPPDLEQPATQLSNADKLTTLTGLALDQAIRQFDPKWNGAGLTEDQKRQQAVTLRTATAERIAARSEVFAAGAFTVATCEGPDADGHYTMLVGMLWSSKLARIAEAMYDPRVTLPPLPPQPSIADQFAAATAEHPDWMAFAQGARVWTNEHGERVVVGFGVAPGSSASAVDHAQARLRALAAIQRFVGEKIVGGSAANGAFADQETAAGQMQTFDASDFHQRIEATAREVRLTGVYEIGAWRGKHPWGGTPMEVVALAWTPSGAIAAQTADTALQAAAAHEQRQGGVPSAAPPGSDIGAAPGPMAAPVRAGPSSDASSF